MADEISLLFFKVDFCGGKNSIYNGVAAPGPASVPKVCIDF
jgi:hypothetical protein